MKKINTTTFVSIRIISSTIMGVIAMYIAITFFEWVGVFSVPNLAHKWDFSMSVLGFLLLTTSPIVGIFIWLAIFPFQSNKKSVKYFRVVMGIVVGISSWYFIVGWSGFYIGVISALFIFLFDVFEQWIYSKFVT